MLAFLVITCVGITSCNRNEGRTNTLLNKQSLICLKSDRIHLKIVFIYMSFDSDTIIVYGFLCYLITAFLNLLTLRLRSKVFMASNPSSHRYILDLAFDKGIFHDSCQLDQLANEIFSPTCRVI